MTTFTHSSRFRTIFIGNRSKFVLNCANQSINSNLFDALCLIPCKLLLQNSTKFLMIQRYFSKLLLIFTKLISHLKFSSIIASNAMLTSNRWSLVITKILYWMLIGEMVIMIYFLLIKPFARQRESFLKIWAQLFKPFSSS